ncbi:MAG: winged helix-turn-helix domain-containing protein [Promethearchaeota archaeon]
MNNPEKLYCIEELLGSRARVKILKVLAINKELTISLIINKTRLNYNNVLKHLNYLKTVDLVDEKKFGRIKIFRYRIENVKARSLKKLIEIWEGII